MTKKAQQYLLFLPTIAVLRRCGLIKFNCQWPDNMSKQPTNQPSKCDFNVLTSWLNCPDMMSCFHNWILPLEKYSHNLSDEMTETNLLTLAERCVFMYCRNTMLVIRIWFQKYFSVSFQGLHSETMPHFKNRKKHILHLTNKFISSKIHPGSIQNTEDIYPHSLICSGMSRSLWIS